MSLNEQNRGQNKGQGISIIALTEDKTEARNFIAQITSLTGSMPCEILLIGEGSEAAGGKEGKVPVIRIEETEGMSQALNAAMAAASYDILHITDTTCVYDEKSFHAVFDSFRKDPRTMLVSLTPYVIDVKGKSKKLINFTPEQEKIDLAEVPEMWSGYLFAFFLRRSLTEKIRFREELSFEYRRAFLADLFTECGSYRLLSDKVTSSEFQDTDYYNYAPQYHLDWYLEETGRLAKALGEPAGHPIRQRILMEFIGVQFACNLNNRDKGLVTGEYLESYKQLIAGILQQIDDHIITIHGKETFHRRLPPFSRSTFLCIKYGLEHMPIHLGEEVMENGNKRTLFLTKDDVRLAESTGFRVNIWAMNLKGSELEIEGELSNIFFDDLNNFHLFVVGPNGQEIPVTRSPIYNHTYLFGATARRGLSFRVSVPLSSGKAQYRMLLRYMGLELELGWAFTRPQARLIETHKKGFWNAGGYCVRYNKEKRSLIITRSNPLKTFFLELRYDYSIMRVRKTKASIKKGLHLVALRWLYYLTMPKYGKRNIWITFDQLFKGGDNGEYFYRYVSELKNGKQDIYYIVNPDTKEFKDLNSRYGTAIPYNSRKSRLLALHSKVVLTTRAGVLQYLGFTDEERFFRGLYNFDIVCLQHGLSIQRIAEYQNRLFDNLKFYYCVSRYEVANLSKPIYGYFDKSMLKLTGAPRYDGLKSVPKKQILITPTWRRNVTAGTNTKGKNHEYSSNFKQTEYYRIYNSLISDEKLIQTARETGYRLIYLLHPILSPQIGDFDRNDYVDIIPGSEVNYEKILTESALMLTDHSGIMYDFAYQRKPLVYYHPDSLPPQYGEGGLKYETMGFGPVCKTHQQVVDAICQLMRKDCQLEDMYRARIDDFFEFNDFNNCARAYEATLEFQASKK